MAYSEFFNTDERGRTTLFYAAERGDMEAVKAIIFKLMGTGIYCQRLALIEKEDVEGLTAIDVAEQAGHNDVADLLRKEKFRMEYFE